MVNLIIDQGLVAMSEWSDKIERQNCDMEYIDKTYKDKWYVHRVIRFLRDNPERAPDYIYFVGDDWETRDLEDNLRKIEAVIEKWKKE